MSEIALISDVHGNYPALREVLRNIDARGIKRLVCLGDLVGYYSMINEVIGTLRERSEICLVGNHDHALCHDKGIIERSKTCTKVLVEQLRYIEPEHLAYLRSLGSRADLNMGETRVVAVHGGLEDPVDEYLREVNEEYFNAHGFTADMLLSGHTHMPSITKTGRFVHVNPGAVGQPRDGDPRASYCILRENGEHELVRVHYPVDEIVADMRQKGFEDYISIVLYRGIKIGG